MPKTKPVKPLFSIATVKDGKINWVSQPSAKKQSYERLKHFAKSLGEDVICVEIREVKNAKSKD